MSGEEESIEVLTGHPLNVSTGVDKEDRSVISFEHPLFQEVIATLVGVFHEQGGENYLAFSCEYGPEKAGYEVIIQRSAGKSQATIIDELKEKIKKLESHVEILSR